MKIHDEGKLQGGAKVKAEEWEEREGEGAENCSFGKNGKRSQMQIDSFQYQFQNNRASTRGKSQQGRERERERNEKGVPVYVPQKEKSI